MLNLFRVDSPLYKFMNMFYNLLVLNFLWILFSIPLFTIGASTTALFYVTRKIFKDRDYSTPVKGFWKSFKGNFRQATVIWLILSLFLMMILFNIRNIHIVGNLSGFFIVVYYVILAELIIISIYIFPLLSRYYIKTADAFKASFFIGNRHFITSILCLMVLPGIYYLISIQWYFIFFTMAIYSFWTYYMIKNKFEKYEGTEYKEDEGNDEDGEKDEINKNKEELKVNREKEDKVNKE
ncbi:MAG TPA: DUF624 domain-containing protein [Halanaerobiales bacterium]|nr:DUF624 domain-containing protein [Halanaerobiales bacterium]